MKTLNLGILAHVDAGKTSLTERLLYAAGVIDEIGSVDAGSTQTDSLPLERQRGITIRSAVVSFTVDDVTINLIDTPGHSDFITEVERVLSVLDGAVLVISAVEGVQAQTRVLMRALQRLCMPTLVFVNKIDQSGAVYGDVVQDIADKITPAIVSMGSVRQLGSREARFDPYDSSDRSFVEGLTDLLTDRDEMLLADFVDRNTTVTYARLRSDLADQTQHALAHPVFHGSAATGAGVEELMAGMTELLPTTPGDVASPVSGIVFKVERGSAGEKIAYVRMFSGVVRVRDRLGVTPDDAAKVTAISVFDRGSAVPRSEVVAGQIAKLWGLAEVRIGQVVGDASSERTEHHFAPPSLETVIEPSGPASRRELLAALIQLAEQDPLINLRQDDGLDEISVSLYGEVQKEVIQATLADDYGVDVTFRETTTLCVERPVGVGAAVEVISKEPNPFLATIGLRLDPAPYGTGVAFRLEVELGSMPPAFFNAVEQTVMETLGQGLHGWDVTDVTVTMTHAGYWARQSHAHGSFDASMSSTVGDFRNLTPLVLMGALREAGTRVFEPIHRFELEIPEPALGPALAALTRARGAPLHSELRRSSYHLTGEIPAAHVHTFQQELPRLTQGEGVLTSTFERYRPIDGAVPSRPRTDHDPLNRAAYLLRVARRT